MPDDLKTTPLNKWHHAHGGKMVDFGGWDMPVQYSGGILEEHLATRKFGGLFDVSHMGRFIVSGRNAVLFLQHVLTNNAEALRPWQAQYTLIANENGGLIDDAYLYRFDGEDYMLVVNASNAAKDWEHLTAQAEAIGEVELEDKTAELAMIAFQGPLSGRVLELLLDEGRLPDTAHNFCSEGVIAGIPVRLARTGYTGEPVGFEIFCEAAQAEAVWNSVFEAGEKRGISPIGLGARDTLRLEAGMPLYGHEFGEAPGGGEFPAFGFPLTRIAVSFSSRKGDFIGRKALMAQFEEVKKLQKGTYTPSDDLRRRIRPVALMDKGIVRQGDELFVGDTSVGIVTSGTVTPFWVFEGEGANMAISDDQDRRAVALAYVDAELKPGTELEAAVRKRRLKARIVKYHGRSEAPPYFRPIPADSEQPAAAPAVSPYEKKALQLLKRAVDNHTWRQDQCINMIPSEMTVSPLVRLLSVSDPSGRYAEHKKLRAVLEREVFYYQGTDFIGWVEDRLAEEMADYLGCSLVEGRVVSGQMANTTVFAALVDHRNRTDRRREAERISLAMTNHLGKGGHLSAQPMGALRHFVARDPVTEKFSVVNFPVLADNPYMIDVEETAKILDERDPEIIILGKSMVIHREPVAEVREMISSKKEAPLLMYDMAHVLGLVGPHFQEPFKDGADIVTGSTHKTFFGTQRGVIGSNFEEDTPEYDFWDAVRRHAFPGQLSNHHLGTLLGLYLAALEMNAFKDEYQPQVIRNAKAFAKALADLGVTVEGDPEIDYTETHQVLVNVGYARGCDIAQHLEENNIVTNYQALPGDEGFTASSGLRLGVSEMTRFGMKEKDWTEFAEIFADAVLNHAPVQDRVAKFREGFLDMQYCFCDDKTDKLKKTLLESF